MHIPAYGTPLCKTVLIHTGQVLTTMLTKSIRSFKSFLFMVRPRAGLSLRKVSWCPRLRDTEFLMAKPIKIHQSETRSE